MCLRREKYHVKTKWAIDLFEVFIITIVVFLTTKSNNEVKRGLVWQVSLQDGYWCTLSKNLQLIKRKRETHHQSCQTVQFHKYNTSGVRESWVGMLNKKSQVSSSYMHACYAHFCMHVFMVMSACIQWPFPLFFSYFVCCTYASHFEIISNRFVREAFLRLSLTTNLCNAIKVKVEIHWQQSVYW